MTDLAERWPLPELADVRDALLAAYDDPSRGYHDTLHLTEVLDRLDDLAAAGVAFDQDLAGLAAWFHDAVYDGERDAEERSAVWAEEALAGTSYADEVARLVRLTETHDPSTDDPAGQALCDADLAILASPPERYDAYLAGVRRDYAHLPTPTSPPVAPRCCTTWPAAGSCSTRRSGASTGSPPPEGTSSGSSAG